MNKLLIIGNLTANAELRTTPNGINVCTFNVAVNRRAKKGEEQQTDYIRVTAWRQLGENCARYLTRGKKVAVIGPVSARAYQTKSGGWKASLEMTADEVEFCSAAGEQPRELTDALSYATPEPQDTRQDTRGEGWTELTDAGDLPF